MTKSDNHVSDLLIDYVLNLLPAAQRRQVEQHAADCHACRLALQQERALAPLVKETLAIAGQAAPSRLHAIMPAPPAQRHTWVFAWQRQLALVSAVVILFLVSLSWQQAMRAPTLGPAPTALSVTATSTQIPTATTPHLAATSAADSAPLQATVAHHDQPPAHRPVATPIAAIFQPQP